MIERTNLYREPHKVNMQWERITKYRTLFCGRWCIWFTAWKLKGGLFSEHLRIVRYTPKSRYRILFNMNVIAVEKTLTEAKYRALAEMSVLLHQEKQIVGIHAHYAGLCRHSLKRWKDEQI